MCVTFVNNIHDIVFPWKANHIISSLIKQISIDCFWSIWGNVKSLKHRLALPIFFLKITESKTTQEKACTDIPNHTGMTENNARRNKNRTRDTYVHMCHEGNERPLNMWPSDSIIKFGLNITNKSLIASEMILYLHFAHVKFIWMHRWVELFSLGT